jgi:hypothetical protein
MSREDKKSTLDSLGAYSLDATQASRTRSYMGPAFRLLKLHHSFFLTYTVRLSQQWHLLHWESVPEAQPTTLVRSIWCIVLSDILNIHSSKVGGPSCQTPGDDYDIQ